jgi:hypothetical protein
MEYPRIVRIWLKSKYSLTKISYPKTRCLREILISKFTFLNSYVTDTCMTINKLIQSSSIWQKLYKLQFQSLQTVNNFVVGIIY